MRRDLTALIVDEIHDERLRILEAGEATLIGALAALSRADRIRLAAELAFSVEETDKGAAAVRAAEIRRRLEGVDDDVLRAPFPRGKVG